jgi:cytochrome c oxidase assembly protein subunit 15
MMQPKRKFDFVEAALDGYRWLAITTTLIITAFWFHAKQKNVLSWPVHALAVMVLIQFTLGIITLLTHVAIPVATMHQGGALILLGLLVINLHKMKS